MNSLGRAIALTATLVVGALGSAPAEAQDRDTWAVLADVLLIEVADGNLERALLQYEALIRELPADDPYRPSALHRMGRVQYTLGDIEEARETLRECVRVAHRDSIERPLCLETLGQLEQEQASITSIPVKWNFNNEAHGFFHPWRYADKGTIRIRTDTPKGDPALSWVTEVDVRKGDQLVVGFIDPWPIPRGLRFKVHPLNRDTYLRMTVSDVYGRKFTTKSRATLAPAASEVTVTVDLKRLKPLDNQPGRMDPSKISEFVIQDVTAYYGTSGPNEVLIDDFEVY